MEPNPLHIHDIPEMCSRIYCTCIVIGSPYFHPICKWWIHSIKWLPRAVTELCRGALLWWDSPLLSDLMIDMHNFLKFTYRTSPGISLEKPTNHYCNSMGILHSWQDGSSAEPEAIRSIMLPCVEYPHPYMRCTAQGHGVKHHQLKSKNVEMLLTLVLFWQQDTLFVE